MSQPAGGPFLEGTMFSEFVAAHILRVGNGARGLCQEGGCGVWVALSVVGVETTQARSLALKLKTLVALAAARVCFGAHVLRE
jgi:hypothetical protein